MVSKGVIAGAVAIIIVVVAFGAYAAWTYPREVVSFPVNFTAGADLTREQFTMPALDSQVQVVISIQNGNALWQATILSENGTIWSHTAVQGGQTAYSSGWISLQPGDYNFSFGTLGLGGLQAQVTITAKGGFW